MGNNAIPSGKTYREAAAEAGEKRLLQCAQVLLLLTLLGGICGLVQPLLLLPLYLLCAAGLHWKWKPARFLLAVTMLAHLAWMLVRSIFLAPLRAVPRTAVLVLHGLQWLQCLSYLGLTAYLYLSPDVAAYYQNNEASCS